MKRILIRYAVSILLILSSASCKKDISVTSTESPQYHLNFTLSAGYPFIAANQLVSNNVKYRYYINQLRYYIGFPRLIKADSTVVPLSDLVIVAYDKLNPYSTIYGTSFTFKIPTGKYIGIRFGIGVPPSILDTIKHFHNVGIDPLNGNYGMIWPTDPTVVRHIAIDMFADTSAQQNQAPNREYQFHILNDHNQDSVHLYTDMFFADAFTVNNGDSHVTAFNLDFNNIFFNSARPIDLKKVAGTDMFNNDPNGLLLGELINKNFYSSLTKQ